MRTLSERKALAYRAWGAFFLEAGCSLGGLSLLSLWLRPPSWVTIVLSVAITILLFHRLRRTDTRIIPCLNYHSVTSDSSWMRIGKYLSISPRQFERQLKYLAVRKYESILVRDLDGALAESSPGFPRVCLTFDDGYLDNWCHAFPLLKKYRFKATVFLSGNFIDPVPTLRPTSADPGFSPGKVEGYLSLGEVRSMHESGLVEFGAHGKTHARIFASPDIDYFHFPPRENIWVFWALTGLELEWWRHSLSKGIPQGYPIFIQKQSLLGPGFLPDPAYVAHVTALAATLNGATDNQERLRQATESWRHSGKSLGRMETQEEFTARCEAEIFEPKSRLEEALGVPVRSFCWPENRVHPELETKLLETGYAYLVSNEYPHLNRDPGKQSRVSRIFVGTHFFGFPSDRLDFLGFVVRLRICEGDYRWLPIDILASLVSRLVSRSVSLFRRGGHSAFGDLP